MVYAADNLQNGTIRLYGEKYYIDFQLYHHYDNYTGSILSIQDSTNETQRLIMFAIEKRLIRETYFNLSEKINFLDTVDQRITVFTLIKHQYDYDYNIGMDEYTFIVVSKRSTKSYLTADWYHIKTNNGTIQDSHLLPPRIEQQSNQTMNETNIFIRMDSAFRLLFDDEQYLFTIINRRVFVSNFFPPLIYYINSLCFSYSGPSLNWNILIIKKMMLNLSMILMKHFIVVQYHQ